MMKKLISTMALLAMLVAAVPVDAQKHRHTPRIQVLADTTATSNSEVKSLPDTATVDSVAEENYSQATLASDNGYEGNSGDGDSEYGVKFVIAICSLVFFFTFLVVVAVLYYAHQQKKIKLKMIETLASSQQPIPENLLGSVANAEGICCGKGPISYAPGIRQCCLGIGLAIFLGVMMGGLGIGIGVLIFFIGLGKVITTCLANRSAEQKDTDDRL